ncbi:MAG TPA: biotin/lipoyl-containing protein [Candidatus Polarisedimenticolia bacterium]|nr:biotin/lipoyl-containing protein [Candidatus Polarisedimenticolia bacterium]
MTARSTTRFSARVGESLHQVELEHDGRGGVRAVVDGRGYALSVTEPQDRVFSILTEGMSHEAIVQHARGAVRVRVGGMSFEVVPEEPGAGPSRRAAEAGGRLRVAAVMPGRVLRVLVEPGARVAARQGLVVVEAMKMENEIAAPRDAVVRQVLVSPGRTVETGETLIVLE